MRLLGIYLLFLVPASVAYAGAGPCVPLLARSGVLQGIPYQSSAGANDQLPAAYLNLLGLVLEGIDEIAADAFGHADRSQIKVQLLNKLMIARTPINPLDEFQADNQSLVPEDFTRPATSRNLTNFSPKLSTLADSGQFDHILENLSDSDWQQIRQAAEQKLTTLQNLQRAQTSAKPSTQFDFEDSPDLQGNTRLHRLIIARQFTEALRLVESSRISTRYINHANNEGHTVLDLLHNGSDLGRTFIESFRSKKALSNHDLIKFDEKLIEAAQNNNLQEIQRIYDIGHNMYWPSSEVIRLLHSNMYTRSRAGREISADSPLLYAIKQRHVDSIELLIKLGANIDAIDTNGYTPLIAAIIHKAPINVIEALLLGRPNLELKNSAGEFKAAAFFWAIANGRPDVMQILVDHGANINALTSQGENAFHALTLTEDEATFKFLLQLPLKASVNDTNHNEQTPLHYAVRKANVPVTKALLRLGASPTFKGNFTYTPMYWANSIEDDLVRETILAELKKYIWAERRKKVADFFTWKKKP